MVTITIEVNEIVTLYLFKTKNQIHTFFKII